MEVAWLGLAWLGFFLSQFSLLGVVVASFDWMGLNTWNRNIVTWST